MQSSFLRCLYYSIFSWILAGFSQECLVFCGQCFTTSAIRRIHLTKFAFAIMIMHRVSCNSRNLRPNNAIKGAAHFRRVRVLRESAACGGAIRRMLWIGRHTRFAVQLVHIRAAVPATERSGIFSAEPAQYAPGHGLSIGHVAVVLRLLQRGLSAADRGQHFAKLFPQQTHAALPGAKGAQGHHAPGRLHQHWRSVLL